MKLALIVIPWALSATPAMAETVALDCYLDTDRGRQDWAVNLDEASRTVSFAHEYGRATHPAVFKRSEVRWAFGDLRIDRTTMQFTRRNMVGDRSYGTDVGMCRVAGTASRIEPASQTKIAIKEG